MSIEQIKSNMKTLEQSIKVQGLDILEIEGKRSIRMNFESEGRPVKWKKKKRDDGRGTLRGKTNRLFNTINSFKDLPRAAIVIGSNLPYSKIHQEGGTIRRKAGTVKLRQTKSGQYRFANSTSKRSKEVKTKAGVIVIPARPFLVIPEMDAPRIINKLSRIKI